MVTFIMNGKYSMEAVRQISTERHQKVQELVNKFGGEMKGEFCMLGEKDMLFIVELPSAREAMKLSVALSKMTGIAFSTSAAVTVKEFLELMADVYFGRALIEFGNGRAPGVALLGPNFQVPRLPSVITIGSRRTIYIRHDKI
jgi:uncharacterized protein with GYD domain